MHFEAARATMPEGTMSLTALLAFGWLATVTPPASPSVDNVSPAADTSPSMPAASPEPISSPTAATPSARKEREWTGTNEATITIHSNKPLFRIDTHEGVVFHLNYGAEGALCLANIYSNLHTEPKGISLSFSPSNGVLVAAYDKEARALCIYLHKAGGKPLVSLPLPLSNTTTRYLLQQRNQLALYAIPADGSCATLVWFDTVDYIVNLRNADRYELCRDLKITMGNQELSLDTLRSGIKMDALDEIADIKVTGTSPEGEPFDHLYKFNYPDLERVITDAYIRFLHVVGPEPGG